MKSRTSFFNGAAFRKDVTRFSPLWGLYTVFLLLCLFTIATGVPHYAAADSLISSLQLGPAMNLCYAVLCAELLFGDLFNSRMCNALHAMPLRRESWFFTHILSGLCFSFLPNLLICLLSLLLLGSYWTVALWWLLGLSLQYLFFFGLAVFAALCVGSRFAMALVYGLINFLSMLAYWLVSNLYEPLLYGIRFNFEAFTRLCPVWQMSSQRYLTITRLTVDNVGAAYYAPQSPTDMIVSAPVDDGILYVRPGWYYLAIAAVLGVALLVVALLLYRRRKLECAGDFIAVRQLSPVFLVLYTLAVGTMFHMFGQISDLPLLFLAVGVAVGFFTGRMLLKRTIRVFQPKALLGFGALAALLIVSFILTSLDPLGVTRWVPKREDVTAVKVNYNYYGDSDYAFTQPEEIDTILRGHEIIIQTPQKIGMSINMEYTLKDGSTVKRYYNVGAESAAGDLFRRVFSRSTYIFGEAGRDVDSMLAVFSEAEVWGQSEDKIFRGEELRSLVEAILLDCEAGNAAQDWNYHLSGGTYFELDLRPNQNNARYFYFRVFESCENTIAWLKDHGCDPIRYYD